MHVFLLRDIEDESREEEISRLSYLGLKPEDLVFFQAGKVSAAAYLSSDTFVIRGKI